MTTTHPHHAHALTVAMGDLQAAHNQLAGQLRHATTPPTDQDRQTISRTRTAARTAITALREAPGFNDSYEHVIARYLRLDERARQLDPDTTDPLASADGETGAAA